MRALVMQDIFARMKQKQFTDRLLQDTVKEFGLPSNSPNLRDTLINMAACSNKEAACFWLMSDIDSVLNTLTKQDREKMFSAITDFYEEDHSAALFNKIVEALKDAN
jgi:hypothetical protein